MSRPPLPHKAEANRAAMGTATRPPTPPPSTHAWAGADGAAARQPVALALYNKGVALRAEGQRAESLRVLEELLRRFADAPEPLLQRVVADLLIHKGE